MIDVLKLTTFELKNLIENHRRKGITTTVLYFEAREEFQRRTGKGLRFSSSFEAIKAAAKHRRFISYKEIADHSGAKWHSVHYAIGGHMWDLIAYAHDKGWPMLSAIVVNKQNIKSGDMEPETLKGFIAAARGIGHEVIDEVAFLKQEQLRVFEWAQTTIT